MPPSGPWWGCSKSISMYSDQDNQTTMGDALGSCLVELGIPSIQNTEGQEVNTC